MSPEFIGLIVAFVGGVLFDHFLLNKIAGMVTGEVAKLQADVAAVTAKVGTVLPGAAPAVPAAPAPVVPAVPVAAKPAA